MPVQKETYLASILLEQLLGEHIIYLRQKGYQVNTLYMKTDSLVETDIALLKRVFDNVFANLEKYADVSREIAVSVEEDKQKVIVKTVNYIDRLGKKAETTKIGVKTCEKIMQLIGGTFVSSYSEDSYRTVIQIPISESAQSQ